jgi:hypothetical protein
VKVIHFGTQPEELAKEDNDELSSTVEETPERKLSSLAKLAVRFSNFLLG